MKSNLRLFPREEATTDFDQFWRAYPRRQAKGRALRAWRQEQPPIEAVLTALGWQVTQGDWAREGGQYIPLPATWINDHRWEDEPFHPPQVVTETSAERIARLLKEGREA